MKHPRYSLPLLVLSAAAQNANAIQVNPDTFTVQPNSGPTPLNVLANDVAENPDFTGFVFRFVSTVSAMYGSVFQGEDNQLYYQPPENFTGEDSFVYEVDDGLSYGSTDVTINVAAVALDSLAQGPTNQAVARVLEELCTAIPLPASKSFGANLYQTVEPGSDLCGVLSQGDAAVLNAILREIAPEEALIQRDLLSANSRNKTSRLYQAIASMRAGRNASVSINGTHLPFGGAAGDGLGSPWTFLSSLQIASFEHDQTGNEAGYDSDANGLMLGLGYRLNGNLNLGAAFDWTGYDVDYDGNSGGLDADIYSFTGFLSWYRNALALDLQLGYSSGDTRAQRRLTLTEDAVADSDYSSNQLDISAQMDWSWQRRAWAVRPFLRLDYLKSNIDAFAETGTSIWLVAAEKQSHEQLNTSAGLDTSYTLTYSWGVLVPSVTLSLVNQANLSNSPVAFQLLNEPGEYGRFELRADSPDSLFYQWDLTSAFILAGGLSTFLGAQILSGYDGVSAYQVNGGVNWEF
jgi:uncharacterized protein YhjY with autotransporter beta-barrel domain